MSGLRERHERGSATPFMVIVALALLVLGGLVVDGSGRLSASARARAYAEEAARAAAQKIDPTKGPATIVRSNAEAAIGEYCAEVQAVDDNITRCEVDDIDEETGGSQIASVTVVVEVLYEPIMAGFFLTGTNSVEEFATAHPIQGVVEPELDAYVPPSPIVDTSPVEPGIPVESNTDTGGTVPSPDPSCETETETETPPGDGPGDGETCETDTEDPPPCRPRPQCEEDPGPGRPRGRN